MKKNIFRFGGVLTIIFSVIFPISLDRFFIASSEIKSFPGYLLESSWEEAVSYQPSFSSRFFFRKEVRVNRELAWAVTGFRDGDTITLSEKERLYLHQNLPAPLLLHRAIFLDKTDACLRLASLYQDPLSRLYSGIAALEDGSLDQARQIWESLGTEERQSWLGRKFRNQLKLSEDHNGRPLLPVFDRKGELIGSFIENQLNVVPAQDTLGLPVLAMEEAIRDKAEASFRGIRTSIDLDLQQAARNSLRNFHGSIVILEPRTGEVMAAASDSRTLRRDPSAPFRQQYEPASISKLITSSAAIRKGIDIDSFMRETVCTGAKRYGGEILWCSFRSGELESLDRAMAHSCNIAFADLGIAAGRQAVINELLLFGFDRPPLTPFHFGRIVEKSGNARQLADLSIGLESTTITPVHGALTAAVFANDGIMPEPTLVSAAEGFLGISPKPLPRPPGSWVIADSEAILTVQEAMREVAETGTGRGLAPDNLALAMKTGTGSTAGTGYVTNYVGFLPADDPALAFCVRVTHQPTSARVRKATRKVMTRFLRHLSDQKELLPAAR